jgi:hypothetical protein
MGTFIIAGTYTFEMGGGEKRRLILVNEMKRAKT